MAELKWDAERRPHWRDCPVVDYYDASWIVQGLLEPATEDLLQVFRGEGYKLQTWGRPTDQYGKKIVRRAPHWIAVRGQTPLHHDPAYPRYSHHLKLRVDPGVFVRGLDRRQYPMRRGIYYVLDTHSPHQVVAPKGAWNVAVSMDDDEPMARDAAIEMLANYAKFAKFLP